MALRQELHRRGLRYRVQVRVPTNKRRAIDIAFTRAKLAVYVDGCFWHGCPQHYVLPKSNSDWWQWKIARNIARDRDTDRMLQNAGWTVIRVWEHEDISGVADRITHVWAERTGMPPKG
jgi:DNA mismatch endonuclease (patch repair protein)